VLAPPSSVVADFPVDVILNGPPAGSIAVTGAGLRSRPWVGPWPTGGSLSKPVPPEARKTALTAILGVWGPVWRNPRP